MTYARKWTPNKGTNSSYGMQSFQAPQRRPETTPRRIGRVAREIGRKAVNVAVRNRYRLATNLAGKVGRYYFENQLDYVSRTPWGDMYRLLTDEMPWAQQGRAEEAGWRYPPGYSCSSYRDLGPGQIGCGNVVAGMSNSSPLNDCSRWHFTLQAYTPMQPHHNMIIMGPGLSVGCLRMHNHLVVKYPVSTQLNPADFYWQPETEAPVLPLPMPLPQTPRHGRTRRPMPMLNPEPKPEALPLPRYRRGRVHLRPYQVMARQFSPQAEPQPARDGRGGSGIENVPHNRLPPNKRDREDKMKIGLGLAGKLYGGYSEFNDFTESVAKAVKLPNGRDCRSRNPYKAWACIVANRDKLDRNEAAGNIIEDQIEDYLIGQFGRAGAKAVAKAAAAGYYRSPVGLQFGGAYHRKTLEIGEIERIK